MPELPTGDVQDTDGAEVTVNVTNGIHVEWEQVGENCSCAAPTGALAGTSMESKRRGKPGRRGAVRPDRRQARVGDQRPGRSGKTRVLAEAGRAWSAAGLGQVVGITPSQSARNTLAAGVPESDNSAQFLGHLPDRRGARGPVEVGQAPLLLVDEASMLPGPDLADLISYAEARGRKVILAGDTSQLQAVENGGGMSLLVGIG